MADRRFVVSLRARMALLGTATAAVILVGGALLLGQALREALTGNIRQATVQRAHDLGAVVKQGTVPDPVQVTGDDEVLVQVVGADGDVIAASVNVHDDPALPLPRPEVGRTTVTRVPSLPVDDDTGGFLVATTTVDADRGPTTIHAAASLDDVTEPSSRRAGRRWWCCRCWSSRSRVSSGCSWDVPSRPSPPSPRRPTRSVHVRCTVACPSRHAPTRSGDWLAR